MGSEMCIRDSSEGLRLRFKPSEAEQEQCRAFGIEFAKTVLGK